MASRAKCYYTGECSNPDKCQGRCQYRPPLADEAADDPLGEEHEARKVKTDLARFDDNLLR
jgi:hypothetical protein